MTGADVGAKGAGIGKMHAGPSNRKATTPAPAVLWRWWPGSPATRPGVRALSPRRRDRSAMTATARNGTAPHRRLVPAVRTACLLLALACLAFPSPLAAQTSDPILISNQNKTFRNNPYIGTSSYAQQFRTGSASGVYAVSDVILTFSKAADRGTTTVTVRSDSSGNPADTALATMTLDSAGLGNIAFTPSSPVRLDPQTRYWVVAEHSTQGTSGPRWDRVHIADGLDTDSAAGWAIDQSYQEERGGGWIVPQDTTEAMKIRLRGTVLPAVTVAADGDVTEGTDARFTLTRTGTTAAELAVEVTVSETGDMVASVNEDRRTVRFGANSRVFSLALPTQADSVDEPDSTVTVTVVDGSDYDPGTPSTADVVVSDDDNADPTGKPTIDDTTPLIGETLTAKASGIDDPDGLTNPSFTWQWIQVLGGTETRIPGATAPTYTVVTDDVWATLKVEVSFTDDDGTAETVESAETAPVPLPMLSIGDASVNEGDTGFANLVFTVTLAPVSDLPVKVAYADSGSGTATSGTDYEAVAGGTLAFAPGESEKRITVRVRGDMIDEEDETIEIGLGTPSLAEISRANGTGTIADDDAEAPTGIELCLTLGPGAEGDCETLVTVSEGAGETPVTVRATVTGGTRFGTAQEIAVSVAKSDESGAVDVDEVADFTVTIPAGEASGTGTFLLTPEDDERDERDETLTVSGRLGEVAITPEELTVTVTDDDVVVVSVEDVEVREDAGEAVFEVTLSHPSVHTITLTATFQDGTATQGEDYEPSERRVVFDPGDTEQAVRVAVLDDALIEETETFTVRVSDPSSGAMIGKGEATGTILDAETLTQRQRRLQYALAAFGRTVVQDLMMALEARQGAGAGGSTVTLGGTPVPSGAVSFEEVVGLVRRHVGQDGTLPTIRDFLARSHFQLALGEGGADEAGLGAWMLWGRGSYSRFAGQLDPAVATEGNVFAGQLGLEWRRRADLVAGVLVNGSEGAVELTADAETEVEPRLLSLHPYVQWSPWAGLRTWGMLGYGWGEATVTDTSNIPAGATDLAMVMAAGGGSHTLASLGGLDWSLGTKGFFVEMETEEQAGRLAAVEAEAWQLRLLLEGRGDLAVGGAGLSGTVGLAARVDGGDAERGLGLELGSGVTYGHPGLGLDVTVNGRVLLAHEATDFEDAGVSLAVRFDPGERGQGLYLALTPAWGNATSGVRALWANRQPLAAGPAPARVPSALRLDAEVGYTMPWWRGGSTMTAYGAVAGDGRTTRQYRVGQRLAWTPSLGLSLEADRRERDGGLPEHSLWLTGSLRY